MGNSLGGSFGTKERIFVEPLEAIARFAFDWADVLCSDHVGCADYHRMWSLVRLLESGGAAPAGEAFFDSELPKVAVKGKAKVVLSGAADTGLMALACNVLARAGVTPEIVIVDRCATPLRQSELFGEANGILTTTFKGNLKELDLEGADAVIAHSFLYFIPQPDRASLFASWAKVLRPRGKVLMSQRLVPPGGKYERKRPAEEINERKAKLQAKLAEYCPVNAEISSIIEMAERLWLNPMGGNGVSEEQLHELCHKTGFELSSITYDRSQDSVSPFTLGSQTIKRVRANIVMERVR